MTMKQVPCHDDETERLILDISHVRDKSFESLLAALGSGQREGDPPHVLASAAAKAALRSSARLRSGAGSKRPIADVRQAVQSPRLTSYCGNSGNGGHDEMKVTFAFARHRPSLLDALEELNRYYHPDSPASRDEIAAHLHEHLLSSRAPTRLIVAAEKDEVFGLAAISIVYSIVEPNSDKCKQLAMKELFVRSCARERGVGGLLMEWIAKHAQRNNCTRVDWSVRSSNGRGISFYVACGAELVADRLSYRLDREAIWALANRK
jgi:ribosomal protein S18 acetylase RimI-like enzyme